jgi:hypothetical protein
MPHFKGEQTESQLNRPFHETMRREVERMSGVLDQLQVHEVDVQMPTVWGDKGPPSQCVVKMRSSFGDVTVKQDTFEESVLSALAALEMLQSVAGKKK